MCKRVAWLAAAFATAAGLLMAAIAVPAAAADAGPKPSVDVVVSLNGAPVPEEPFYAQMLTCDPPDFQLGRQCGFDDPACDQFLALAVPEPSEACTWRLRGQPTVWGGECTGSQCHFTYFLPQRFRLAAYLPGSDQLFVSNPVTRSGLYGAYRLELAADGSARLVESTPLLRRAYVGGALVALLLSLIIELAVGLVFVRLTHAPRRALWGVLIGNLLTVPLLWVFVAAASPYGGGLLPLALGEVVAVLVEGAIIALLTRGQMRPARAFAMSLVVNLASFLLGAPVLAGLALLGIVQ